MNSHSLSKLLVLCGICAAAGLCCSIASRTETNAAPSTRSFDENFTGKTLRIDYHHSGTAGAETLGLDALRVEGDWVGPRRSLETLAEFGKYRYRLLDAASGNLLFSQGFSSIYGEWETVKEARAGHHRSFHESARVPEPRRLCRFVVDKRGDDGKFVAIFDRQIDPRGRRTRRPAQKKPFDVTTLLFSGAPGRKVDILILGDGYTREELPVFREQARRFTTELFETEPFRSRRSDFNVRALEVVSTDSGVSNPRADQWHDSPLGLSFNAFDLERYMLTYRNRALRDIAAQEPYDTLILLANTKKYGGGGIYGLWATCGAGNDDAAYVFVHEFGHSFAGLADEYYTSAVAYEDFTKPGAEPWEPNITALLDPENLKWKHLVEASTPLPTPWRKSEYDSTSMRLQAQRKKLRESGASAERMAEYFARVRAETSDLLQGTYAGKIGAFEGAGYEARGLYRSEQDCIMFSRNTGDFCRVCQEGIHREIDRLTK